MENLSAFVYKDQLDGIVATLCYREHLRRYPGVVLILEPNSSSFAVYVLCHVDLKKGNGLSSKRLEGRVVGACYFRVGGCQPA
jgi:hypothetical protein